MSERAAQRVRKLLALSKDPGATPGERETAEAKAWKLMEKHNLDPAEFTSPEPEIVELPILSMEDVLREALHQAHKQRWQPEGD